MTLHFYESVHWFLSTKVISHYDRHKQCALIFVSSGLWFQTSIVCHSRGSAERVSEKREWNATVIWTISCGRSKALLSHLLWQSDKTMNTANLTDNFCIDDTRTVLITFICLTSHENIDRFPTSLPSRKVQFESSAHFVLWFLSCRCHSNGSCFSSRVRNW